MKDDQILVTGRPARWRTLAITLARDNEVWGVARFRTTAAASGSRPRACAACPSTSPRASTRVSPSGVDYVLNFAVAHGGPDDFDRDLAANAEATGLLMQRFRDAQAFLHCSSTGVYEPAGHHRLKETDPLGDNHRVMMPTYSVCKIAAEAVARTAARQLDLPTTIARLNVPYGDNGGWPSFHLEMMLAGQPVPVHPDAPSLYNPIHDDDIAAQVPRLLEIASVPATIVNWAGRDQVSIEEWCAYLGELTGLEPKFVTTDQTIEQRDHRQHADARADRRDDGVVARRLPPHGRGAASRAAEGLRRRSRDDAVVDGRLPAPPGRRADPQRGHQRPQLLRPLLLQPPRVQRRAHAHLRARASTPTWACRTRSRACARATSTGSCGRRGRWATGWTRPSGPSGSR